MLFVLPLLLSGVSYGLQPLSTKDGLGLVFSGDSDPSISAVTVDGSSVSESVTSKGGFSLKFIGEDASVVLSDSIIENGDLTTSASGWSNKGTFSATAGRDGTGAICPPTGQLVSQTVYLNESTKFSRGVKISGWSSAAGVNGEEDRDYSLYMDIKYEDGSNDWAITVQVTSTQI